MVVGRHHVAVDVDNNIRRNSTREILVLVSVSGQGEGVELLCDLHSVHHGHLVPGVRDHVGAEVVVGQGSLQGPPLPVAPPVVAALEVPALLDPADGAVTGLSPAAVGRVEGLLARLLQQEPLGDVLKAYVDLGCGRELDVELVGLGEGLPELPEDPPDIVGDHGLGHAHGVQFVDGLHVAEDDVGVGLLCLHPVLVVGDQEGQLLEVLRQEELLEVLAIELAPGAGVGGGELGIPQELVPNLLADDPDDSLDDVITRP